MDGGSIKSESRALLSNESPKNPDQIIPINFGIKYKPAKLGLQYTMVKTKVDLVYEIPLQPFVNTHVNNPQTTEEYVEQLFELHHDVLSKKVISRK